MKLSKKLRDNVAKAYILFVENETILVGNKVVTNRQDFIKAFRKTIKYKNVKSIIAECNETIKPKLEEQLNESQRQINKIQRQLEIIK